MARPIVSKEVFPKTKIFEVIACAFDVSLDWLLSDHGLPEDVKELYPDIMTSDSGKHDGQTLIRLLLDI